MGKKLLVCDIDGTLVKTASPMSELTKSTIYRLKDEGYLFGLASGRPLFQIKRNVKEWGLEITPDFLIGMNGAEYRDEETDTEVNLGVLSADEIKRIFDYMHDFRDKGTFSEYTSTGIMFERADDIMLHALKKYGAKEEVTFCKKEEDMYDRPNAKIMFRLYDFDDMPVLEQYLIDHPADFFTAYKTQGNLMEFMHPDTNKGDALKAYIKMKNYDPNDIWTFGDMTNDNTMLAAVPNGVCLCDGSEDTKAVAKYITEYGCAEDGWAKFVLKTFFNE